MRGGAAVGDLCFSSSLLDPQAAAARLLLSVYLQIIGDMGVLLCALPLDHLYRGGKPRDASRRSEVDQGGDGGGGGADGRREDPWSAEGP